MTSTPGITVYGCEQDEADLFHELSPRFGVAPTITSDVGSETNVASGPGNRCVSVGHKSVISAAVLRALKNVGVEHVSTRSIGLNHIDLPAAAHLGATWAWEDEFYYNDHLNPRFHVILAGRLTELKDPKPDGYPGATFGHLFPLSWCIEENGGRHFYTSLGHKIAYYSDPNYQQHVLGGILWVLRVKN